MDAYCKQANLQTCQAATEAEKRRNQLLTGSLKELNWAQINWLTTKLYLQYVSQFGSGPTPASNGCTRSAAEDSFFLVINCFYLLKPEALDRILPIKMKKVPGCNIHFVADSISWWNTWHNTTQHNLCFLLIWVSWRKRATTTWLQPSSSGSWSSFDASGCVRPRSPPPFSFTSSGLPPWLTAFIVFVSETNEPHWIH